MVTESSLSPSLVCWGEQSVGDRTLIGGHWGFGPGQVAMEKGAIKLKKSHEK